MLKNKSQILFIVILLVILIVIGWFTYNSLVDSRKYDVEIPAVKALVASNGAPYTDINGNSVDLSSFIGQVLVVNSWASWSPSSVSDLQSLSSIVDTYESGEVQFLAINRAEPKETASAFIRVNSIDSKVQLVLDPDDNYYKSIEAFSMPVTIVYDRDGQILYQRNGRIDINIISDLLNKTVQ